MKKAFTMMELIFVLIVIGILVAIILPSTRRNPLQEAAVQLQSHIRYTQHLALMDDKFDASDSNWYKKRWQLVFSKGAEANNQPAYTIFSDTACNSTGNVNVSEVARNPESPSQYMTGGYSGASALDITHNNFNGMKRLNLGMTYGITSVLLSGGCSNSRIAFDYLGRPFQGDQNTMTGAYSAGTQRLIISDCNVTLSAGTSDIILTIRPETGYVNIRF